MRTTDYQCESPPSVFYDSGFLDVLAALLKGVNNSVRIEDDHGALDCPIILDADGNASTGIPSCLPAPRYVGGGNIRSKRRLIEAYLGHLQSIAKNIGIRLDPLLGQDTVDLRPWFKQNFSVDLSYTTLVDLRIDDASLLKGMRGSYPGCIREVQKTNPIKCYSALTAGGPDAFERWLALYRIVTGRANATPTQAAEDAWRAMFKAGKLDLIVIEQETAIVSGVLVCVIGAHAYYGQSATHPTHEKTAPFSHALIWTGMQRARDRGARMFEMGPVHFGSDTLNRSEKEMSISFFKMGFGGQVVPWLTLSKEA